MMGLKQYNLNSVTSFP